MLKPSYGGARTSELKASRELPLLSGDREMARHTKLWSKMGDLIPPQKNEAAKGQLRLLLSSGNSAIPRAGKMSERAAYSACCNAFQKLKDFDDNNNKDCFTERIYPDAYGMLLHSFSFRVKPLNTLKVVPPDGCLLIRSPDQETSSPGNLQPYPEV